MNRYLFHTENGELSLPIEMLSIARCIVDHAFSLEFFHGSDVVVLRIEGPFTIEEQGTKFTLDPNEPENLGPAIALIHAVVMRARASAEGQLSIALNDGRQVTVESSKDFEAWEVIGPRGAKAVCKAGGGISTWGTP